MSSWEETPVLIRTDIMELCERNLSVHENTARITLYSGTPQQAARNSFG